MCPDYNAMTANDLDNVESKWSTEGWWHRRSRQVQRRARRQRYWCVILQLHIRISSAVTFPPNYYCSETDGTF